MKKIAILFTLVFVNISILLAQAPPQGINYQAVVYSDHGNNQPGLNVSSQVLRNKNIKVRFTIIQNATSGSEVYKEIHSTTTDAFGMFSLVIGQGTQVGLLAFSEINWGAEKHFLKVEIDKDAGSNFVTMSNQQLLSVPYALYSDKSTYSTTSGNGIISVLDNGNGTLTFTYFDGSTYTTPVLTGLQGPQGIQGPAGQNGTNGVNGTNGANGLSAYEIWLAEGNTGTESDFLNAISGPQGVSGQNGLSAYEVWLTQGNTGTEQDYLTAITGPQGVQGIQGSMGAGLNILNTFSTITELPLSGNPGDAYLVGGDLFVWSQNTNTWNNAGNVQGPQGLTGQNGLSAYEVWLSQGNTGTVQDYLTAIVGPQGSQGIQGAAGQNGTNGQSAYEVWLSQGNTGTVQDYLIAITGPQGAQGIQGPAGQNGVNGTNGQNGLSAYEVWLSQGNSGTVQDYLTAITGPQGNGFSNGTNSNQIMYWNGSDWVVLNAGSNGQTLTICNGSLAWTNGGQCPGSISSLNCNMSVNTGVLREGFLANGVSSLISYNGGNGGYYDGQIISSTGVTGLTATLISGNFANGSGNLNFIITGTPIGNGIATFSINIGSQSCNLNLTVEDQLIIGTNYLGGIVAYILQPTDPGYDPNTPHGLIAAPLDQGNAPWGCGATFISTSSMYGDGGSNTIAIVSQCNEVGIAAKICSDLMLNNFDDWSLPSINELQKLFDNRNSIGGFSEQYYWSSTGSGTVNAQAINFFNLSGLTSGMTKNNSYRIRAVRYF